MSVRIGTRGSPLARWQAQWVADALAALGHAVELVSIATLGDLNRESPIGQIGTAGVFTKELERALLENRIDVAVHSLKDLPTELPSGLMLAAVPPRESPSDVLVSRDGVSFHELPRQARIGTGSLRRQSQLLHARPDLDVSEVRGNVETRLAKLDRGDFAGLVLAEAGLKRLGLAARITEVLPPSVILSAVGQGALGLEIRVEDTATRSALSPLDDPASRAAVSAERAMLTALDGGCLAPVGAWGRLEGDGRLTLDGVVLSHDGRQRLAATGAGVASAAADLGRQVAEWLLVQGAAELIQMSRSLRRL